MCAMTGIEIRSSTANPILKRHVQRELRAKRRNTPTIYTCGRGLIGFRDRRIGGKAGIKIPMSFVISEKLAVSLAVTHEMFRQLISSYIPIST